MLYSVPMALCHSIIFRDFCRLVLFWVFAWMRTAILAAGTPGLWSSALCFGFCLITEDCDLANDFVHRRLDCEVRQRVEQNRLTSARPICPSINNILAMLFRPQTNLFSATLFLAAYAYEFWTPKDGLLRTWRPCNIAMILFRNYVM